MGSGRFWQVPGGFGVLHTPAKMSGVVCKMKHESDSLLLMGACCNKIGHEIQLMHSPQQRKKVGRVLKPNSTDAQLPTPPHTHKEKSGKGA